MRGRNPSGGASDAKCGAACVRSAIKAEGVASAHRTAPSRASPRKRSGSRVTTASTTRRMGCTRRRTQRTADPIYMGVINAPDYGIHDRPGDFAALVTEKVFFRVQAVLEGRAPTLTQHLRNRPDFPLRGFVRCHSCGRGLTASWSRSKNHVKRYAYYHCRSGPCRLTNISKSKLEGLFAEALEELQPTPGYMRLVTETVLGAWQEHKARIKEEAQQSVRTVSAIQAKLDKLDDAFLFQEKIDSETYERQRDRLRQEMTLAKKAKHSSELDELDVEGILAFAERVLPRASDVWIQASLAQRQHLQKLFFREGILFDGRSIVRTPPRPSAFNWLEAFRSGEKGVVGLTYARSNQLVHWMRAVDRYKRVA